VKTAELYDPATGKWSTTGDLIIARRYHTGTLLKNGKVLVAAGEGDLGYVKTTVVEAELYDPGTGTWSTTGNLATPREGHSATLLNNGKVLVAGGYNSSAGRLDSAELYDPDTGTWSTTGNLVTARSSHTATLLDNGKVLVAGGSGPESIILNTSEVYDPTRETWSPAGNLVTGRSGHKATLLQDGTVLAAGGLDSNYNSINNAELYRYQEIPYYSPIGPLLLDY